MGDGMGDIMGDGDLLDALSVPDSSEIGAINEGPVVFLTVDDP